MKVAAFFFLNICLVCSVSGQNQDPEAYFLTHAFADFKAKNLDVEIRIDPRIEFLQTLMLLAGNPHVSSESVDYKLKILDRYADFRTHPAILAFREQALKIWNSVDAPVFFIIRLTPAFELRKDMDNSALESDPAIRALINTIRLAATEMDYVAFFNGNKDFYAATISNFRYQVRDFDEKKRMLDYYRMYEASDYAFCITLNLLGKGNFGPGITAGKIQELYAIISPDHTVGSLPSFDLNEIHYLVWHELSHSFVNPLIDQYYDQFRKTEHLYNPIQASMSAQGYADWRVTLKEHLVRAVTCRLAEIKFGRDFAEWNYTVTETGKKFIYTGIIIETLKEYEKRKEWPFEEVVGRITQKFTEITPAAVDRLLAEVEQIRKPDVENLPAIGEAHKNLLIILPENPYPGKAPGADKFSGFIQRYKTRFENAEIISDAEAETANLAGRDLAVFGNFENNRFLKKYFSDLPVLFTKNGFIGDRAYTGDDLTLISAWLHPTDRERVAELYITGSLENLVNIDWVQRGGTHYHIARGLITLKKGNYSRRMKIWRF